MKSRIDAQKLVSPGVKNVTIRRTVPKISGKHGLKEDDLACIHDSQKNENNKIYESSVSVK